MPVTERIKLWSAAGMQQHLVEEMFKRKNCWHRHYQLWSVNIEYVVLSGDVAWNVASNSWFVSISNLICLRANPRPSPTLVDNKTFSGPTKTHTNRQEIQDICHTKTHTNQKDTSGVLNQDLCEYCKTHTN